MEATDEDGWRDFGIAAVFRTRLVSWYWKFRRSECRASFAASFGHSWGIFPVNFPSLIVCSRCPIRMFRCWAWGKLEIFNIWSWLISWIFQSWSCSCEKSSKFVRIVWSLIAFSPLNEFSVANIYGCLMRVNTLLWMVDEVLFVEAILVSDSRLEDSGIRLNVTKWKGYKKKRMR